MATYEYDNFEITLKARPDGSYDLLAVAPDGSRDHTVFKVPLDADELEQAVVSMAKVRSRKAHAAPVSTGAVAVREVAPVEGAKHDDDKGNGAERLGAALADALFADGVGKAYDDARAASADAKRGIRLTLSLSGAPALLSLPWEFLYRRPRFIASQRHTPLVRRLDTQTRTAPLTITDKVRILGVVSNPREFSKLNVKAEQRRVEKAVSKMKNAGRVELDWLESATPRAFRQALREVEYHVLHYVGHSSFTANNEGAIYLRHDDGSAVEVDSTVLANLLSDQNSLRLVVLNSCEGARTTLNDPYAGVATTLIQLGIPAVVAMQFEISDNAAILFADELYTNLVGRQDPIDAAVAEARKAIYVELDRVEWATPVLFVRDPSVKLFEFAVPAAPLLAPPPADLSEDVDVADTDEPDVAVPPEDTVPTVPIERPEPRRQWPILAAAGALTAAILTVGAITVLDDAGPTSTTVAAVVTSASTPVSTTTTVVPPPTLTERSAFATLQISESDGSGTRLYGIDAATGQLNAMSGQGGTVDSQAVWAPDTNRVAFTRRLQVAPSIGSGVFAAVPGDIAPDGRPVSTTLVPWDVHQYSHFPAWAGAESLWYVRSDGCEPGPGCTESLHRAEFTPTTGTPGRPDTLEYHVENDLVVPRTTLEDVTAIASNPRNPNTVIVADAAGLWRVRLLEDPRLFAPGVVASSLAYTTGGEFVVAIVDEPTGGQQLYVYDRNLDPVTMRFLGDGHQFVSVSGESDRIVLVLIDGFKGLMGLRFQIEDDGSVTPLGTSDQLSAAASQDLGEVEAVSL